MNSPRVAFGTVFVWPRLFSHVPADFQAGLRAARPHESRSVMIGAWTQANSRQLSKLKSHIQAEIAGDWTRSNYHGVDLRECLVPPRKVTFCNGFPQLNAGNPVELWIVLEELPGKKVGYLVVCDDSGTQFGVADWNGKNPPVLLGLHGTFLDALDAM